MCSIDWDMLLKYLIVFLSWPSVSLLIVLLVTNRFKKQIAEMIDRFQEGTLFGNTIKAAPKHQEEVKLSNDLISEAAEGVANPQAAAPAYVMPDYIQNDPRTPSVIAYIKGNPEATYVEYRELNFKYISERIYSQLFGTQIELLVYLSNKKNENFGISELEGFHSRHQKSISRYDYPIESYVDYLVKQGLVEKIITPEEPRFKITEDGMKFIDYIKVSYPNDWDKKAF